MPFLPSAIVKNFISSILCARFFALFFFVAEARRGGSDWVRAFAARNDPRFPDFVGIRSRTESGMRGLEKAYFDATCILLCLALFSNRLVIGFVSLDFPRVLDF